ALHSHVVQRQPRGGVANGTRDNWRGRQTVAVLRRKAPEGDDFGGGLAIRVVDAKTAGSLSDDKPNVRTQTAASQLRGLRARPRSASRVRSTGRRLATVPRTQRRWRFLGNRTADRVGPGQEPPLEGAVAGPGPLQPRRRRRQGLCHRQFWIPG